MFHYIMQKNITNTSKNDPSIVTWVNKNNGRIITITKAEYEVLVTKEPNTLYLIVDNIDDVPHHNWGSGR